MSRPLRVAVLAGGIALGAFSLSVARGEPGYSFGGASAAAGAAELIAGYALLIVGLVAFGHPRERRLGVILVAASAAWFVAEWNNPGAPSNLVFSAGLLLYCAAAPLVAHAVVGYPEGRARFWPARAALGLAYVNALVVLGLLAAAVFDPVAEGCSQCPRNLLLVHGDSGAYDALNKAGVRAGLLCTALLIVLGVAGLARSTAARRRLAAPVTAAGVVYLGFVAADFAHALGPGVLAIDPVDRHLWLGEAAALTALALAVAWSWSRARRRRHEVARLVVELDDSRLTGGLRDVLAQTLGDDTLTLAYPLDDGRLVDADGTPVTPHAETTPIIRDGREVARLSHRPGLLDDPALVEEVAAAARLALENERLQAQARAQLAELRAARKRLIARGDAERRRLERDLHDGAQQQLVGLSIALGLAATRANGDASLPRIREAEAEVQTTLAELRELAQGIFPALLAEEGLAVALEALTEDSLARIALTGVPDERLEGHVEAAAYFMVAETIRRRPGGALTVAMARANGHLVVDLHGDPRRLDLVSIEDRVKALDGRVESAQGPGLALRAEIPCGS